MARVGVSKRSPTVKTGRETKNKAGGVAFNIKDPAERLIYTVGQFFNEPTYYPDSDSTSTGLSSEAEAVISATEELCLTGRAEDALAIARWARSKDGLNMRTTPTVILSVVAQYASGELKERPNPAFDQAMAASDEDYDISPVIRDRSFVRLYAPFIFQRADEPRNAFALWRHLFGEGKRVGGRNVHKTPPNALRRAIRDSLVATPEHLLLKYAGSGSPSLRDVIRVCARDAIKMPKIMRFVDEGKWLKQSADTPVMLAAYNLARKTEFDVEAKDLARKSRATWENLISQFGSSKEMWQYVAPKLGYMATLRNLRNLLQAGIDPVEVGIVEKITDEEEVRNSRQLPFRFMTASDVIENCYEGDSSTRKKLINALDKAIGLSIENLPDLPGETSVLVDISGSMGVGVSGKSTVTCRRAAETLAAIMVKKTDGYVYAFGSDAEEAQVRKADSIRTIISSIERAAADLGWSTIAHIAIDEMIARKQRVDRIIILSDMQCYENFSYGGSRHSLQNSVKKYRERINPNVWIHSVNLAGTVTTPVIEDDKNVNLMSGYSDKIVNLMHSAEQSADQMEASGSETSDVPSLDEIRERYLIK